MGVDPEIENQTKCKQILIKMSYLIINLIKQNQWAKHGEIKRIKVNIISKDSAQLVRT